MNSWCVCKPISEKCKICSFLSFDENGAKPYCIYISEYLNDELTGVINVAN